MGGWRPEALPDSVQPTGDVRVLHVDDQEDFLELARLMLEREDDAFAITSATSPAEARTLLAETVFDCVVSDYDMPPTSGLEFLREVRDDHPGLPFVLFTGKGSEEIASKAITAGVTDYVQKGGGREQYEVLANRIRNAVDQRRAREALQVSQERLARFIEQSPLGIIEWNQDRELVRMNEAAEDILGYDESELRGKTWEAIVPKHEHDRMTEVSDTLRSHGSATHSINENVTSDGDRIVCEWYNRTVTGSDGETVGVFSQFQDVTDREEYRRRLETLIENLPGIVYRCQNEPEWPYEFLAGECEALTGYATETLAEDDVEWGVDVIVPEEQGDVWDAVQDALERGARFELTYDILTRDGTRRTVWERGQGVYGSDGELVAIEGFITDVTTTPGNSSTAE